jgi:GNAT superfamily N-acetyltransferase
VSIRIAETDWADAGATALRDAQRVELDARYGEDSEPGPKPTAGDITAFFVAYSPEGEPVGCGGLRQLDASHGEIKRMYVRPGHRGQGVSVALLEALEADARARGWDRLVLETGTEQPDAMRFYEREGYSPIPNFGYYVGSDTSRCYSKPL